MADIHELMDRIPVDRVAQQAGVDEADARRAIEAVLPALVGGMQANARDADGKASLERALAKHEGALPARLQGDVDTDDGAKIVSNVFGGSTDQIAAALGGHGGGSQGGGGQLGGIIKKVLPIVAPIVLAWLAERLFSGGGQAAERASDGVGSTAGRTSPDRDNPFGRSGGGAGSGGAVPRPKVQREGRAEQERAQQPDLGDLLGGLLGGTGGQQGGGLGGGLGDLLGGLLGGGKR